MLFLVIAFWLVKEWDVWMDGGKGELELEDGEKLLEHMD